MLNPLILTLIIDEESQQFFDALRLKHFPPDRNFLKAHLTLFHQLPAGKEALRQQIAETAAGHASFSMQVNSVVSIGRGVAYKIESDELTAMHKHMQILWTKWLIPQDRQKIWPHITIQNKVDAATAVSLLRELQQDFQPFVIQATGLALWEYLGGPWRFIEEFTFRQVNPV